jgi:hypothetical protein
MGDLITHPRLIAQKEKELEEYERQIEEKRIALFRDYEILTLRNKSFESIRKRHMSSVLVTFAIGFMFGILVVMIQL